MLNLEKILTNKDALSIIKEYVRIYLLDIKLGAKVL